MLTRCSNFIFFWVFLFWKNRRRESRSWEKKTKQKRFTPGPRKDRVKIRNKKTVRRDVWGGNVGDVTQETLTRASNLLNLSNQNRSKLHSNVNRSDITTTLAFSGELCAKSKRPKSRHYSAPRQSKHHTRWASQAPKSSLCTVCSLCAWVCLGRGMRPV